MAESIDGRPTQAMPHQDVDLSARALFAGPDAQTLVVERLNLKALTRDNEAREEFIAHCEAVADDGAPTDIVLLSALRSVTKATAIVVQARKRLGLNQYAYEPCGYAILWGSGETHALRRLRVRAKFRGAGIGAFVAGAAFEGLDPKAMVHDHGRIAGLVAYDRRGTAGSDPKSAPGSDHPQSVAEALAYLRSTFPSSFPETGGSINSTYKFA